MNKTAPHTFGKLNAHMYSDRSTMGTAAANHVAQILIDTVNRRSQARVIFACAPSQDEFLAALRQIPGIPWRAVTVFHMDDYVGLRADDFQSFRYYLKQHLLDHVDIGEAHLIAADSSNPEAECIRYAGLLSKAPIDLICLGVGENGHIAFNDPPVADFKDPDLVKVVSLDVACRQQQVHDGCFPDLDSVPQQAITLTIPVFLHAHHLSIVVPGSRKKGAVEQMLAGPVSEKCPASILRQHPQADLFLDAESADGVKCG